ncbi:glycosyltransferase, partial [Pontibacter rugosus]
LFVYNRPTHTKKTVAALLKNKFASDSDLFIYSDAPKKSEAEKDVSEVRQYISQIQGFKSVKVIEREKNLGLATSIIQGVTEVVNIYGRVIVLEDDLVTAPSFLSYMNTALKLYQQDDAVISVHGYVYPANINLVQNTFFLKGADCWGWATWKRGWDLFETDGSKLLQQLHAQELTTEFDFDNSYPYTQMLIDQINKKNDSWAIRWYASAFLENKYTLYPTKTLVKNIGLDMSGTHSGIDATLNDSSLSAE